MKVDIRFFSRDIGGARRIRVADNPLTVLAVVALGLLSVSHSRSILDVRTDGASVAGFVQMMEAASMAGQ